MLQMYDAIGDARSHMMEKFRTLVRGLYGPVISHQDRIDDLLKADHFICEDPKQVCGFPS